MPSDTDDSQHLASDVSGEAGAPASPSLTATEQFNAPADERTLVGYDPITQADVYDDGTWVYRSDMETIAAESGHTAAAGTAGEGTSGERGTTIIPIKETTFETVQLGSGPGQEYWATLINGAEWGDPPTPPDLRVDHVVEVDLDGWLLQGNSQQAEADELVTAEEEEKYSHAPVYSSTDKIWTKNRLNHYVDAKGSMENAIKMKTRAEFEREQRDLSADAEGITILWRSTLGPTHELSILKSYKSLEEIYDAEAIESSLKWMSKGIWGECWLIFGKVRGASLSRG